MFSELQFDDTSLESGKFAKELETHCQVLHHNARLPHYLRELIKKRDNMYLEYLRTRSNSDFVSYYKIEEICKDEIQSSASTPAVNANSLVQRLKKIQCEMYIARVWYARTKVKYFWDVFVGLIKVKEAILEIKYLQSDEHNVLVLLS